MTKELFILFVYDTQLCQGEEDDPQDAVLYFHPNWVTDQQRLALCGQLMGATQFYLTAFSCPRILSLSSGKFAIEQYGRYLIVVGTDRNVPDWVIDHRANTLHCLLQLYHCDLDTIAKNALLIETSLRDKLSHIFETFLPILQYTVDVFGTIPTIRLPKSASNVFLEAIQILHCCQEKKGVLGGMVLYQNRVVATQLCASLTKDLVCTDPYRIKSPADSITTTFHLPIGVQLLKVYIEHQEFTKLLQEAMTARTSLESVAKRKQTQKRVHTILGKSTIPKEQLSGMKRDISRIFTVHEEEGETDADEVKLAMVNGMTTNGFMDQQNLDDLNTSGQESTPMHDLNLSKVLHEHVVSICKVSEIEEKNCESKTTDNKHQEDTRNSIEVKNVSAHDIKNEENQRFLIKHCKDEDRSWQSLSNIPSSLNLSPNRFPLRSYSFGLPRFTQEDLHKHNSSNAHSEDVPPGKQVYKTITDPYYPVFRSDGLPISRSLFDEHLAKHYKMLNSEQSLPSKPNELNTPFLPPWTIKQTDCSKEKQVETSTSVLKQDTEVTPVIDTGASCKQANRRSLSLPLKNLTSEANCDSNCGDTPRKPMAFPPGALESPSVRTRMMGSIPLTPLMSKLTSLALEERSGGFYSRDSTPNEFRDFGTLPERSVASKANSVKTSEKCQNSIPAKKDDNPPQGTALYVFGQQSMALLLLLEEESSTDPELIHSLWETSVGSLNRLEAHLRQCLEHISQGNEAESYSYICLDPRWDMLQRGGPWGCLELDMVTSLHHDFMQSNSLTEIVVRCEDSTVYGYQCGKTEVFYRQSSSATVGLPTPSDLMGVVPLKARRRLERDHGIVLL